MKQRFQKFRIEAQKTISIIKYTFFCLLFFPALGALGQQTNKIQKEIDELKSIYSNSDQDYITDGQRTVWVKSYKKWQPDDFVTMKKEDPDILKFLNQAIQHNRYDVLEQLLPDYYTTHGGVKGFAADVLKEWAKVQADTSRKAP